MIGGNVMSIVQAYITKNFVVVGGDKRAMTTNKEIASENFKKIVRINKNIIIGMTGSITGNYVLFSEFINEDLSLKNNNYDEITYKNMIEKITKSYYDNNNYLQKESIHSLICGWNGEKFLATTYFTKDKDVKLNKPIEVYPQDEDSVKVINCGENQHYLDVLELKNKMPCTNILQFKNLFKDVLHIGITYDNTINECADFETIKLKDVII